MISARINWLVSILGALSLAGLLIAWPEVRGLCPSCAPITIAGIPSSQFVRVRHASDVDDVFANQVGGDRFLSGDIPRIFIQTLPSDLDGIADVERRKQLFLQAVLPQILRLNEAIRADRALLIVIGQTPSNRRSTADAAWFGALARQYRANPTDHKSLLARVDVVPPSLAIAQGAIESGWGTSRFAIAGNALFGQRTFDPNRAGIRPKDVEDANFKVRRFESLMGSIWGYMITLNTHPAHAGFRQLRAQMRQQGDAIDSIALAGTLTQYSEEGERYVNLVQNVILTNNLRRLDDLQLANSP
jgi:Bax protein